MTREEQIDWLCRLRADLNNGIIFTPWNKEFIETTEALIGILEQEPCDDVCEWFEQYVDIATDIVELRFSDGTVKRAKRGLYMRDIEKSIRKMLIDQVANEKKQEPCDDAISRQAAIIAMKKLETEDIERYGCSIPEGFNAEAAIEALQVLPPVTPQPRSGEWIERFDEIGKWYECDQCHTDWGGPVNYCPNCGCKMTEVEE